MRSLFAANLRLKQRVEIVGIWKYPVDREGSGADPSGRSEPFIYLLQIIACLKNIRT